MQRRWKTWPQGSTEMCCSMCRMRQQYPHPCAGAPRGGEGGGSIPGVPARAPGNIQQVVYSSMSAFIPEVMDVLHDVAMRLRE